MDLEFRMGPHTRFHLRIDALRASDASLMAGKGREWTKASHLRVRASHPEGLASHQGFPKIGDNIAVATKHSGFIFFILIVLQKMEGVHIYRRKGEWEGVPWDFKGPLH